MINELLNYSITILALIGGILAWRTKLKWSKEYKEAKDAEIKAKSAQIDTIHEKLDMYKSIISEKLLEHSKKTIANLELLLIESENSKQTELSEMLDKQKEFINKFTTKYSYDDKDYPLVTILSHELRTPLNAIIGFSALLSSDEAENKQKMYRETIEENAHELLSRIDDLFNLLFSLNILETTASTTKNIN